MYFVKTPFWLSMLYPKCSWKIPVTEKVIYLSFDDGPHPEATPFVLETLAKYKAKASFFCIGKNVLSYPNIYNAIIAQGHVVGNHTYDHFNGWKTSIDNYIDNVKSAATLIDSNLFRPPYGRITRAQINALISRTNLPSKIIMWDVLSGDFDQKISPEKCCKNVIDNVELGSIIVFHDSQKAWKNMSYALPKVLAHFTALGYRFDVLPLS
jgi:peptidoglycan/xylan/chitin deacetylase (PgdA/CDA1 family)